MMSVQAIAESNTTAGTVVDQGGSLKIIQSPTTTMSTTTTTTTTAETPNPNSNEAPQLTPEQIEAAKQSAPSSPVPSQPQTPIQQSVVTNPQAPNQVVVNPQTGVQPNTMTVNPQPQPPVTLPSTVPSNPNAVIQPNVMTNPPITVPNVPARTPVVSGPVNNPPPARPTVQMPQTGPQVIQPQSPTPVVNTPQPVILPNTKQPVSQAPVRPFMAPTTTPAINQGTDTIRNNLPKNTSAYPEAVSPGTPPMTNGLQQQNVAPGTPLVPQNQMPAPMTNQTAPNQPAPSIPPFAPDSNARVPQSQPITSNTLTR